VIPKVDLRIGNGISHQIVADRVEATRGAFAVANLNDTDADGKVDNVDDDGVIDTIHNGKHNEIDLIPLDIYKPTPYDPNQRLTLTLAGSAKLWKDALKTDGLSPQQLDEFLNSWPDNTDKKRLWVEATAPSNGLRDIGATLMYKGIDDTVKATAIWATVTAVEHDRMTPAQLFAKYPVLDQPGNINIKASIQLYGGTGLIPPGEFIQNGILLEFIVSPPGIKDYQDQIYFFDASRRMQWSNAEFDASGNQTFDCRILFPSEHPDMTNDDGSPVGTTDDETRLIDSTRKFYVYDAPGAHREDGRTPSLASWNPAPSPWTTTRSGR